MNRFPFIITVISTNLFFVFFLIYKNSRIVELSFQKQHYEKKKEILLKEKDRLQQQLCIIQNKTTIQHFVKNELNMEKITTKQLTSLPRNTNEYNS